MVSGSHKKVEQVSRKSLKDYHFMYDGQAVTGLDASDILRCHGATKFR